MGLSAVLQVDAFNSGCLHANLRTDILEVR